MLRKRNRCRRQRVPLAQLVREMGTRARTAFRHARVALWRFKRSPEQQDRASMIATFAFIGVFALGSVDAIVTGGADFTVSSAYAGEMPASTRVIRPQPATTPIVVEPAEEAPATKTVADENIDYSFTTEELLGAPLLAINDEALIEEATSEGDLIEETASKGDKLLEILDPATVIETADVL